MQFGKRASEAPKFEGGSGGGNGWMRTLKEGEHRLRFLDETDDWYFYWEHFNPTPGGFPFPCTGDKATCPGCTSGIEKMEKASPKYAVNTKSGDYVNVYKFPTKFFNKMVIRSERNKGTVTDRDYLITRIGTDTNTDYDVDMMMPSELSQSFFDKRVNIEEMLMQAFKEAWPEFNLEAGDAAGSDSGSDREPAGQPVERPKQDEPKTKYVEATPAPAPKAEEKEVTEAELRAMTPEDLMGLCISEGIQLPPEARPPPRSSIGCWRTCNRAGDRKSVV